MSWDLQNSVKKRFFSGDFLPLSSQFMVSPPTKIPSKDFIVDALSDSEAVYSIKIESFKKYTIQMPIWTNSLAS